VASTKCSITIERRTEAGKKRIYHSVKCRFLAAFYCFSQQLKHDPPANVLQLREKGNISSLLLTVFNKSMGTQSNKGG
jgi:hypothetical protein